MTGRAIETSQASRAILECCSMLLVGKTLLDNLDAGAGRDVQAGFRACQLGLGDALLIVHREFHEDPVERHQALRSWMGRWGGWADGVLQAHAEGISNADFTEAEPCTPGFRTKFNALSELARTVWLWLEDQRLEPIFHWHSIEDYVWGPENKSLADPVWRAPLRNMQAFGWRGLANAPFSSPTARLFISLPLLLWVQPLTSEMVGLLQKQLLTKSTKRADLARDYLRLWESTRCERVPEEDGEPGCVPTSQCRSRLEGF